MVGEAALKVEEAALTVEEAALDPGSRVDPGSRAMKVEDLDPGSSAMKVEEAAPHISREVASHGKHEVAFDAYSLPRPLWELSLRLSPTSGGRAEGVEGIEVRTVRAGDEDVLITFLMEGLSGESRRLFAPYPYASPPPELRQAVASAIADSAEKRVTLSLVATSGGGRVVAHGFLWGMGGEVPELGVAVADAWQRRGLGLGVVGVLVGCAAAMGKAAVELTTMQDNAGAFRLYEMCGFEALGIIRNPLGCDVTAAFEGRAAPTGFADEHQMVRFLKGVRERGRVLEGMARKRQEAKRLFGGA